MGFSSATPDMIEMKDSADWDSYLESETPIILQAGASWCGPGPSPHKNILGRRIAQIYTGGDVVPPAVAAALRGG